jgi:hypothetical protein
MKDDRVEKNKVIGEVVQKALEEARQEKQEHVKALKSTREAATEALKPIWEYLCALNPSDDKY